MDDVQPPEGQGDQSLYSEYLDKIPEDARDIALEAFKSFDANTTRKFQEAADYRKGWEPFEELGVKDRNSEEVRWALNFVDAAFGEGTKNPQEIQRWFDEYAKENGLTKAEQNQLEQEYIDPNIESLVEERLQKALGPVAQQLQDLTGRWTAEDQRRAEAEAASKIESQLEDLKAKNPDTFDRGLVEKFVANHMDDPENAVQKAFDDAVAIVNQIQKDTLQGKANQPPAAESGGSANGTPEPPPKGEALKHANAQALEMLRAANRS